MKSTKKETMVYDVSEVQELLGLGRTTVYVFIREVYENQKPFRVIKIGSNYKIPKDPFDNWIQGL